MKPDSCFRCLKHDKEDVIYACTEKSCENREICLRCALQHPHLSEKFRLVEDLIPEYDGFASFAQSRESLEAAWIERYILKMDEAETWLEQQLSDFTNSIVCQ